LMSIRGKYEDASTLLFLVPFIVSGAYGVYLWVTTKITPILPTSAYLQVTRDPYVFLVGILAVFVGVIVDLRGVDPRSRRERLAWDSGYLQKTAAACFVLSLLMAWYANGFVDISGAAQDFVVGRYSIVFPAVLVLFSYLVNPALKLGGAASYKLAGFVAMLAVPAVVYEVGKRSAIVGLASAAALMVVGLYLLLRAGPKPAPESSSGPPA
jgi:hypothetical protein